MTPFDSYPHEGKVLLGRLSGSNSRKGYGFRFMQITRQTTCAYCDFDLVISFENWLQLVLDHVVPKGVCKGFSLRNDWTEDCINRVLACAACNGFDNRYKPPTLTECPVSLEAFCQLRDEIFEDRKARVAECRKKEREFFERRPWEQRVSQPAKGVKD